MSSWTEEREDTLRSIVGDETPVSRQTVADAATALEVSERSVGSKLRKMGYEVEKAGSRPKTFTAEQEESLREFVENNVGVYTFAQIAEQFEDGAFTARQIQGKLLSMDLRDVTAPTPKEVTPKKYSEKEENTIVKLTNAAAFLEDIAEALNKPMNSIRGKCLSLYRNGLIDKIPTQRDSHAKTKVDPFDAIEDTEALTVEQIAEKIGKSARGVKVMLTNRGLNASNYKAKVKKEAA